MKWCKYVNCWCEDVNEITGGQLKCNYDCINCEECEEIKGQNWPNNEGE